jgi:hypothetical protein
MGQLQCSGYRQRETQQFTMIIARRRRTSGARFFAEIKSIIELAGPVHLPSTTCPDIKADREGHLAHNSRVREGERGLRGQGGRERAGREGLGGRKGGGLACH